MDLLGDHVHHQVGLDGEEPRLTRAVRLSVVMALAAPDGIVLFSSTGWTKEKGEELIRLLEELLPGG